MAQSLHQVYGHIVFSTKDRKNLINPQIETELYRYMSGIVKNLDSQVIVINGMPDHVHLIIRASKSVTDIKFMQELKGSSSRWMSDRVSGFKWQSGYGWFSVSPKDLDQAAGYVKGQKKHHETVSFQDELRSILKAYNIPYDEKYLWD